MINSVNPDLHCLQRQGISESVGAGLIFYYNLSNPQYHQRNIAIVLVISPITLVWSEPFNHILSL